MSSTISNPNCDYHQFALSSIWKCKSHTNATSIQLISSIAFVPTVLTMRSRGMHIATVSRMRTHTPWGAPQKQNTIWHRSFQWSLLKGYQWHRGSHRLEQEGVPRDKSGVQERSVDSKSAYRTTLSSGQQADWRFFRLSRVTRWETQQDQERQH